ncbi:hypothetical protein [Aquimarina longa]|uniref:hypothetical protein n=1 Tax=Aquimarina longa TaxID=1080221 RepID=UPI000780F0F9|nr:hypothetical protein [Aquimarina longa]
MEIRLAKIYDNFPQGEIRIEFLDEISIKEFEKMDSIIKEIEEFNSIDKLQNFVIENDEQIINFLRQSSTELLQNSHSWNSVGKDEIEKVFYESNRLLLNYLTSIKTFLDHSETKLNRKFGKNSDELIKFKNVTSFFYDNSFAYRFFYKLRNYAQHIGLPLTNIGFTSEYDREINLMKGNLRAYFKSSDLLEKYDSWSIVKADFKNKPEINLSTILYEMTHNIKEIGKCMKEIFEKSLIDKSLDLKKMIEHLKVDEGVPFIAYDVKTKPNGELGDFTTIDIPFEFINSIGLN